MPSRRRRRGSTPAQRAGVLGSGPAWNWWTFPAYFALSVGLTVGYSVALWAQGHPRLVSPVQIAIDMPFAFGLAHLISRPLREMILRRRAERAQRTNPS